MEQQLWTVGLLITRKLKTGESAYLHCILRIVTRTFLSTDRSAGIRAVILYKLGSE